MPPQIAPEARREQSDEIALKPVEAATASTPWRRSSTVAVAAFCAALAGIGLMPIAGTLSSAWLGIPATVIFFAGIVVGPIAGVVALRQMRRSGDPAPGEKLVVGLITGVLGLVFTLIGAFVAYVAAFGFARGRQLRRFGKVLLPEVREGDDWAKAGRLEEVPPELRAPLAARWRENGRTEHASVAAFARLTLDLMALGAPPRLLHDTQKDADDEIRHTELCFALARGLDGRAESPAAFPQAARARTLSRWRTIALAQLAVDSLIDGALHEGVSARVIAQLAQRCEVPEVRAVLRQLAADEGRHSAHGWDVVEWCLAEGGWVVASALRGALRTIPRTLRTPVPDGAREGAWERFGIHGHALEARCYEQARANLVTRVERLCAPRVLRVA
jgi:hypothetical protein